MDYVKVFVSGLWVLVFSIPAAIVAAVINMLGGGVLGDIVALVASIFVLGWTFGKYYKK